MDAGTLNIKTIFGQDRRHLVPLFQRPYVWNREVQWEPLWEDIRNVAERLHLDQPTRPHFLGAIVLDQIRKPTGHLECRLLVDGQQRLTTIQIVLEAFSDLCEALGNEKYHRALLKLTRNDDPMSEDPDEKFKVWPTNVDRDHFRRVMNVESPAALLKEYGLKGNATEVGHAIADAYLFFHQSICDWIAEGTDGAEQRLEALYSALREYMRMVVIDLGKDDDAQLIFETLNARGTPLLPSDLVKNFLFHRAQLENATIETLYNKYWKSFDEDSNYWREGVGRGHARGARIDVFLHHYLTLKLGDEPGVAHLYQAFRDHFADGKAGKASEMLASLRHYAKIYQQFDKMPEGSRERLFFYRLDTMEITTAYPFLLELFAEFGDEPEETEAILGYLESFLVRRMICQLNTRGYNRLFLDLIAALKAQGGTPASRIRESLLSSDAESNRWPGIREFREAWLGVAAFKSLVQRRVRMVLEALAMHLFSEKTEKLQFGEKLTIEHLMPQKWHANWPLPEDVDRHDAEATREKAIHTFGNLTLLTKSLNPAVSNGPWKKKIKEILKHSALNLNRELIDVADWDEEQIQTRGGTLFDVAKKVWPRPNA